MPLRLRAEVAITPEKGRQYIGTAAGEEIVPPWLLALPGVARNLSGRLHGYLLLHFDASGVNFADTWHPTIDDAKRQAEFEFGIAADNWVAS